MKMVFIPITHSVNNNHVSCIHFVMVNFLLCDTRLLYIVCDSFGRWRGCLQCGQSIVCLPLFRGHTCVCVLHAGCLNDNW